MLCAALVLTVPAQLGWRAGTPEPVLAAEPRWVQLYWKSWEALQSYVVEPEAPGPYPGRFIIAGGYCGFDDAAALALCERWAWKALPAADTLNFALSKVETSGRAPNAIRADGSLDAQEAQGLPLAALAAYSLYQLTGDKAILRESLSPLIRRHAYIEQKYTITVKPAANKPAKKEKPKTKRIVPASFSVLPPLEVELEESAEAAALLLQDSVFLKRICESVGMPDAARVYGKLVARDSVALLRTWSEEKRAFSGNGKDGKPAERISLVPFWGLIGGPLPNDMASDALLQLNNPARFYRRMLWPTIAKSDAAYDGLVRPLHQYLTLRALMDNGMREAAGRAAEAMLRAYVVADGQPALYPLYYADGPKGLVAETNVPYAALISISGFIESVLGFEVDASRSEVRWFLRRTDKHGLLRLRMGDNTISLVARARTSRAEKPVLEVEAERPFNLVLTLNATNYTKRFAAGRSEWKPE